MPSNTPASTPSIAPSVAAKKIIVVVGAESSGNKLIFEILKKSDNYADDEKKMALWWDKPESIECDVERITFRSLPHGGIGNGRKFVDPVAFADDAVRAGYDVRFVVTTRDRSIVERSKTGFHCIGNAGLAKNEMDETRKILGWLISTHGERCFLWNYETFMFLRGHYLDSLYRWLGIEMRNLPELIDGNVKYLAK